MTSSFARTFSFALLALAVLLPYAVTNHTYPIPTFYSEFTALTLYLLVGAAVIWLALCARSRGGASQEPAGASLGATLRRPAKEGGYRRHLLIALRAGPGFDWGFPTRHPVSRKRLAIHGQPPDGPYPVEALASATGPETGARRPSHTLRSIEGRAQPPRKRATQASTVGAASAANPQGIEQASEAGW